jgi:iron complex transport system substrate-binding protein
MGDRLNLQVSIVRSFADHIRIYQKGSFIGTVLEDAGLARPESQRLTDETWVKATKEQIQDLDGDVIFVMHPTPDKGSQVKDLMQDPLWASLKAVQAGAVHEVPDDTWALGIGVLAANEVIDDLFEILVKPRS